jgi:tRNA(fMet)-specific endonuclease VapC
MLPLEVAQYDLSAALIYGEIRADLERGGRTIGPLDMLIAAHSLSLGVTLVTNNEKEFRRVAGLRCEDWT